MLGAASVHGRAKLHLQDAATTARNTRTPLTLFKLETVSLFSARQSHQARRACLLLGGIVRAATDLLLLLGLLALLIDALGDHLVVHLGLGLRLLDAGADGGLPLALALASQRKYDRERQA